MLSRYVVFAGDDYYPNGGADDFRGATADILTAVALAKALDQDWWHIADLHNGMRVVACHRCAETQDDPIYAMSSGRYHPQRDHAFKKF